MVARHAIPQRGPTLPGYRPSPQMAFPPPAEPTVEPLGVLLLPRTLEEFILADQARDLLRAKRVIAVEPARVPFGAFGRMPLLAADILASIQARRVRMPGAPKVFVMFHAIQWPLASALLQRYPGAELWYSRWDRTEAAYDAPEKLRKRLAEWHEAAAEKATLIFAVSEELVRQERAAGREAQLVTLAADSFPAPDPDGTVVAISLGHLGWRTDWALLRAVAERLGDRLVLLLVGAWHDDECAKDEDYAWCRAAPQFVWLGARTDEEAARLIMTADVGIVPFRREPFNEAGLPYRILKYAKLGRRTVAPDLAGTATWSHAVTLCADADAFAAALSGAAGARSRPDEELRTWALAQTALEVNDPLWEGMERLGVI